jgi:CheY-like chemotaxis protein
MRAEPAQSRLTIVDLSGYAEMGEDDRRPDQTGGDAHLVKPVQLNVLSSLLGAETPAMSSAS